MSKSKSVFGFSSTRSPSLKMRIIIISILIVVIGGITQVEYKACVWQYECCLENHGACLALCPPRIRCPMQPSTTTELNELKLARPKVKLTADSFGGGKTETSQCPDGYQHDWNGRCRRIWKTSGSKR